MPKKIKTSKRIGYIFEASITYIIFAIFRILPLDIASNFGSKLAKFIGPKLKWQKIAEYNLQLALPNLSNEDRLQIINKMWDNLGRTFAETPWLGSKQLSARVNIDAETSAMIKAHRDNNKPCIFVGAHLANWEIVPLVGKLQDTPITSIYRHLNNPYVEQIYYNIRNRYCEKLVPKGKKGARELLKTMKENGQAGLLIDQKQNDGEKIKFFTRDAATATAAAELAIKFNAAIAPIRCIRTSGCNFNIEVSEFNIPENIEPNELMLLLNQKIEKWIIDNPEQWLWVHQRWGKLSELPPIS